MLTGGRSCEIVGGTHATGPVDDGRRDGPTGSTTSSGKPGRSRPARASRASPSNRSARGSACWASWPGSDRCTRATRMISPTTMIVKLPSSHEDQPLPREPVRVLRPRDPLLRRGRGQARAARPALLPRRDRRRRRSFRAPARGPLAPRMADQVEGLTEDQAMVAVEHIARFHASWWDAPELDDSWTWLPPIGRPGHDAGGAGLPAVLAVVRRPLRRLDPGGRRGDRAWRSATCYESLLELGGDAAMDDRARRLPAWTTCSSARSGSDDEFVLDRLAARRPRVAAATTSRISCASRCRSSGAARSRTGCSGAGGTCWWSGACAATAGSGRARTTTGRRSRASSFPVISGRHDGPRQRAR